MFTRFNGNVEPFASDATGIERTVFGDTAQSDDINDNLNADFLRGWGIVGVNDNPTKQDFNALAFTISNLVAYLYQQGMAEWNKAQKYLANSYVVGSDGKIYRAKTGTTGTPNEGNDPTTDSTNWESLEGKFVDLLNAQTIAGIKTFSSFPVTPSSAPSTDYQVANKKYVDDNSGAEIASTVEAQTGVDNAKMITPLRLHETMLAGVSQNWQNLTGSRSAGVTYTNTSGSPIEVHITSIHSSSADFSLLIDGINVTRLNTGQATGTVVGIVPNGSTYKGNAGGTLTLLEWYELR